MSAPWDGDTVRREPLLSPFHLQCIGCSSQPPWWLGLVISTLHEPALKCSCINGLGTPSFLMFPYVFLCFLRFPWVSLCFLRFPCFKNDRNSLGHSTSRRPWAPDTAGGGHRHVGSRLPLLHGTRSLPRRWTAQLGVLGPTSVELGLPWATINSKVTNDTICNQQIMKPVSN